VVVHDELQPNEPRTVERIKELGLQRLDLAQKKTETALKNHGAKHGVKNHAASSIIEKMVLTRRKLVDQGVAADAPMQKLRNELEAKGIPTNPLFDLKGVYSLSANRHLS
jgi:hypothetical protein